MNYFCEQALAAAELKCVFPELVPDGYNNFDPVASVSQVIEAFGDKAEYHVAREGSVCIYVKAGPGNVWLERVNINADEVLFDGEKQLFRVWWD